MKEKNKTSVAIIGLGNIGGATFEDMMAKKNNKFKIYGVDLNNSILSKYSRKYKNHKCFGGLHNEIYPGMDIYIVSVYSPEQIETVFRRIQFKNDISLFKTPLIIIESTVPPELSVRLLKTKGKARLVLFPHRFNPNDKEHRVFNLNRVLGAADKQSEKEALDFYSNFMNCKLIKTVPYFIAALSKPAENAYRFLEIAIAEDWKLECKRLGINFDELRASMNTKWNINLKEARDGIGGTCLPKDTNFMKSFFSKSKMINAALDTDKFYKEKYNAKNKKSK